LAFGIRPEERSVYQQLFARGAVEKEYEARVRPGPAARIPTTVGDQAVLRDRVDKRHGRLTAQVLDGEPNAETALEVSAAAAAGTLRLHLRPRTGRTHLRRLQRASRDAPILGEDLYPQPVEPPSTPLQLLARALAFTDPVTGQERRFLSARTLRGARWASAAPRTLDR